jgi:xanthine/uracil permease
MEEAKTLNKNILLNLKRWLSFVFPSFVDTPREKPREMLYVANETPDTATTLIAGFQHALVLLMVIIYVVITGKAIGLSNTELQGFVSLEIIVLGIATLIQGLTTPISSGHLIVHTPSIVSIGTFVAVVGSFGIGAAAGAFIISGLTVMFLARFLPRLQAIFPPEVTGVLLVLLGFSLVKGGVIRFTGLEEGIIDLASVLIASTTLGTIVIFSIWASDRLRVFAVAIGGGLGLLLSAFFGQFGATEVNTVLQQPLVSLPFESYHLPMPKFVIGAILPLLLIEVISAIDSIGVGVAIDKMNNAKWKRADMPMISRLVSCHGFGVFLNGLTGTLSSGTSSANLGLALASGVAARRVSVVTGITLIISAFLPQVATFITLIPQPVMGAIIVYTAGYMFVSGMELILSRMLNSRRMFMVGISMTVGASVILMPELTSQVPEFLAPIFESGLTVGVITAIVLNLIFRIGVTQSRQILFNDHISGEIVTNFLEECGEDWGARHDVIARAGVALEEAVETLERTKLRQGDGQIKANFDEYNLILTLDYPGKKIALKRDVKIDWEALMESDSDDDQELDLAMSNLSGVLLNNLADKVVSSEQNGHAELKLQFSH